MTKKDDKTEKMVMYDVRGIQNYIFRTNKLIEIIGASKIVEKKILELLQETIKDLKINSDQCRLNWKDRIDIYEFDQDQNIQIEVVYEGGGNLIVLYRNDEICQKINKAMSLKVFKEINGLSLAIACVNKTLDYKDDYHKLRKEMDNIKATTPLIRRMGSLPITMKDPLSGLPLSKQINDVKKELESSHLKSNPLINVENRFISLETFQKQKEYYQSVYKKDHSNEFDNLIKEKGIDSLLAIVHIDGNNMGNRISNIIENETNYDYAVKKLRRISKSIEHSFDEVGLNAISKYINQTYPKTPVFRKIIAAGDDITFVCRASIALKLCEVFMNAVKEEVMYIDEDGVKDIDQYGCSSCAGIAIIHSHFPFSIGYEFAEECCGNAKKVAKKYAKKHNENVGNYIDFQICYSGMLTNLEDIRERQYRNGHRTLCRRPYDLDNHNELRRLDDFKKSLIQANKIPRSWAKEMRDAYFESDDVLKSVFFAAKSRNYRLSEEDEWYQCDVALYYDALELMDIWGGED